ncbi:universal stress protein [Actinacidiphila sp. bgisy160]|uniref:universal stress protein n=1 Tax=Actinacidiphila sp. bgisy160 TaxID=3413796 RepID=UPI003D70C388
MSRWRCCAPGPTGRSTARPGHPAGAATGFAERARAEQAVPVNAVAQSRAENREVAADIETVCDGAARALVAATGDAGLIVAAAHRRPGRIGMRLGPVTDALPHHARCPVAVVPVRVPGR